jgi:hypothetical protein
MATRRKLGLTSAFALLATYALAQENSVEIRLTIKYNGKMVPNPDHVTLSSGTHVEKVAIRNGKFGVPSEISRAKTWSLAADIKGDQIELKLSHSDLAYEDWTLHLANRHYEADYKSAVPKGADVRSSCILVLDSEHIDPGMEMFQTNCRKKRQ